MTSGLRDREELLELEEVTEEDFWWRLWIGEWLILATVCAGEEAAEFVSEDALVGGEEARGEDFCGE